MEETDRRYLPPQTPKTPLKSALKSPGAAPRDFGNVLSPTFKEEQMLEKTELDTEKEQVKDLRIKTRVRMAKVFLRGVNFSCSLIVVSMLAAVFMIFNATKHLPPRNNLPAWSPNTPIWPQIILLVIASMSLLMCIVIFWAYFRGGHRRAEKVAVYYTTFAIAFFVFSIIMWGVGAAVLNQSKVNGNGQDIWGWSCKDNKRRTTFEDDVPYALVCRLQDWALVCCIIEVVVEVLVIAIYGVVFYRFYTKRRLRKSMAVRDRARSDLYLAQLRSQSAPNTPGFGPLSPRDGGWRPPPGHPMYKDPNADLEAGPDQDAVQYAVQQPRGFTAPKPFALQMPPKTPKQRSSASDVSPITASPSSPTVPLSPTLQPHVPAAPGEQEYGAVPIPGAYAAPHSPGFPSPSAQGFDFGLPPQSQQQQQEKQ